MVLAIVIAGCLPVISPPLPKDPDQRQKHLLHLRQLLHDPIVLTQANISSEFADIEQLAIHRVEKLEESTEEDLHGSTTRQDGLFHSHYDVANLRQTSELAVLMLTSGSTGNAKAVCLRHGQILSALDGKSKHHGTRKDDVFFHWIGLDHVASLCETHLHAMSTGSSQIHVQASDLLANPGAFLHLIHRHRISYTFAPNFFLALLIRHLVNVSVADKLDLSCLRALVSGGEANVVETCVALTGLLSQHGASKNVIRPGFGMTETCAGMIYELDSAMDPSAKKLQVGSLQVAGSALFEGYHNNEVSTREAFTEDGWFITGDRALKDSEGNLSLVGRVKESIIVNGVKYFPPELETAIKEASVDGATPSYTVVFPHRPRGAETEMLCVAYLPTYCSDDTEARVRTADTIAKSSLGKISRIKTRAAFENEALQDVRAANDKVIREFRVARRVSPSSDNEVMLLGLLEEQFSLSIEEIGVDVSLFDLGVNSVEIIRFKKRLEEKLQLKEEIPLILILTNPKVQAMAKALEGVSSPRASNPVVFMQPHGSKRPLWLVHPGVGEVLVFLNLAKLISDRPVYALRVRGFDEGEEFFRSIDEMVTTYHRHIKETQHEGPYAIAGYSFGAMVAFEIRKLLEGQKDEVRLLGSLNLPPHIKHRMRQLDWIEVAMNLFYFLDLVTEEEARKMSPAMHASSDE
ncbi:MAG: hypothetical protein Q9192_000315 [Flavoplaca navasiana]